MSVQSRCMYKFAHLIVNNVFGPQICIGVIYANRESPETMRICCRPNIHICSHSMEPTLPKKNTHLLDRKKMRENVARLWLLFLIRNANSNDNKHLAFWFLHGYWRWMVSTCKLCAKKEKKWRKRHKSRIGFLGFAINKIESIPINMPFELAAWASEWSGLIEVLSMDFLP